MFRTDSDPDQPRRNSSQSGYRAQELQRSGERQRRTAAQRRRENSILYGDLESLRELGREFASSLDSLQILDEIVLKRCMQILSAEVIRCG